MELNANEIIKALDYCANNEECVGVMCPYYATGCENCMPKDALSLIKELTEENESLGAEKEHLDLVVEGKLKRKTALEKQVLKLTKENERLKAEYAKAQIFSVFPKEEELKYLNALERMAKEYKTVRADTVRKMHSEIKERCIEGGIYPAFVASTIDQIAKEMLNNE